MKKAEMLLYIRQSALCNDADDAEVIYEALLDTDYWDVIDQANNAARDGDDRLAGDLFYDASQIWAEALGQFEADPIE